MSRPSSWFRVRRMLGVLALCVGLVGGVLAASSAAADSIRESNSLRFVPANAAFYSSSLRLGEQWTALANSKAVAKLMENPMIQLFKMQFDMQMQQPSHPKLAELKEHLDAEENQELAAFAIDAVSHEIFVYGDAAYADLFGLINRLNTIIRTAQFEAELNDEELGKVVTTRVFEELDQHGDQLKVPDTLIGFKISDVPRAERQLKRLEEALNAVFEQNEFPARFERETVAGTEYITLRLDGTMIPWDEVPMEELELDEAQREKLIEMIKKKTFVVSLGVRDNYLLVTQGTTNDYLKRIGEGDLLVDREEFAALRKMADKPIVTVNYASGDFMRRMNSAERQLDDLVGMAKQMVPQIDADETVKEEIVEDAKALAEDLKKYVPKPGAMMRFSFLNGRGYEGYAYDWSQNLMLDGSRELTILDHVGSDPLAFYAARGKNSPEDYGLLVKWLAKAHSYFEQFGVPEMEQGDREKYTKVRDALMPLVREVNQVTREKLIPAFADGQGAFVVDAKSSSRQWHRQQPKASRPLPMLEIALVSGVSDAAAVREAYAAYFDIAQKAVDNLHDVMPDDVPEIKLTRPEAREVASGKIYAYSLPEESGIDDQVSPNAALSDDVLVLSLLPDFSTRLLASKSLEADGPLADHDRPLAAAAYVNFAGLMDVAIPWIAYAVEVNTMQPVAEEEDDVDFEEDGDEAEELEEEQLEVVDPGVAMIVAQVKPFLDVIKCFRTYSSVTYFEGAAKVTHFATHIEDLKE